MSKSLDQSNDEKLAKMGVPVAKAILTLTPLAPLVPLADWFLPDPAARRRDDMLRKLDEEVQMLISQQYITKEALASDPDVSAIVLRTARLAEQAHGQAKLRTLRKAALSGIVTTGSERIEAEIALGLLETLLEAHVVALSNLHSPSHVEIERDDAVEKCTLIDGKAERDFQLGAVILSDLLRLGLLAANTRDLGTPKSKYEVDASIADIFSFEMTDLGRLVIRYLDATIPEGQ